MLCGAVLVAVLGVGALRLLRFELGVLRLEGVGDVLEEDQAEDDVLVLGRVHVVAERVGRLPERFASKPRVAPSSRARALRLLFDRAIVSPFFAAT